MEEKIIKKKKNFLIILAGRDRVGKNTVAKLITSMLDISGYKTPIVEYKIAKPLYQAAEILLDHSKESMDVYKRYPEFRHLMRTMGETTKKLKGQSYFAKKANKEILGLLPEHSIIVTDARFKGELRTFEGLFYISRILTVEISRPANNSLKTLNPMNSSEYDYKLEELQRGLEKGHISYDRFLNDYRKLNTIYSENININTNIEEEKYELEGYNFNYKLVNDGNLDILEQKVYSMLEELKLIE